MKNILSTTALILVFFFTIHQTLAQTGVGIDVVNPLEKLDVDGAIKIGTDFNNSSAAPQGGAGTIRWNGTNFEGWDGTQWIQFGGGADLDWTINGSDQYSAVSGNVGIGVTGPSAKLQVSDEIIIHDVNIGRGAGNASNTRIGSGALYATSIGTGNTAVGASALRSTSATGNTAVGQDALRSTLTGTGNTALGYLAGRPTEGTENTLLGSGAMDYNYTGSQNTVVGASAGWGIGSGSGNIFIGYNAGKGSGSGDNRLIIENSNSTSPLVYGEFDNDLLRINGTLNVNNAYSFPTVDGTSGFVMTTDGSGAVSWTDPSTIATADDGDWTITGTDQYSTVSGNVGIGTPNPSEKLDVWGTIDISAVQPTQRFSAIGTPRTSYIRATFSPLNIEDQTLRFNLSDNTSTGTNEIMRIQGDGKVGIGTTAPQYELQIHDVASQNSWLQLTHLGTGATSTDGFLVGVNGNEQAMLMNRESTDMLFYTSSAQRMTISSGGNVGIGAATPQDELHVAGSIRMVDGNQQVGYIPVSDANGTMTWTDPSTIATADDGDWTITGTDQYSSVSGNVGIGTPTPGSKLDVNGAVNASGGGTFGNNITIDGDIYLENTNGTGSNNPDFRLDGYQDKFYVIAESGSTGPASGTQIRFRTAGSNSTASDRVTIDSQGNLGVATTGPQEKLHVAGSIRMVDGNQAVGYIPVSDANGTMVWTDPTTIATADDGDWTIVGNDQYSSVLGNVGIGTTAPLNKLSLGTVVGSSATDVAGKKLAVYNSAAGNDFYGLGVNSNTLQFHAQSTAAEEPGMVLRADGNVGIGTVTPNDELEVQGSIRMVDGNQQAGYVPVSDANGTMTWTDPTGISGSVDELVDADGDTKVQVEESADEDLIRFDMAGTQHFLMEPGRLVQTNSNNSQAFGDNTLQNSTGSVNTAMGNGALEDNTSGNDNIGIGFLALTNNTTGSNNVSIGTYSSNQITTTSNNTVLGKNAAYNYSGGGNITVIGMEAGLNASGSNNTFVGQSTGAGSSGSDNVFLGRNAGSNVTASNRLYIDNTNTASPLIYGEFDNDLLRVNGTLNVNNAYSLPTVDGTSGYIMTTDGSGVVSWTDPTTITTADDGDWTVSGVNQYSSVSGNVGVGTATPDRKLHVQVNENSGLSVPLLVKNFGAVNNSGTGSGIGFNNHNAGNNPKTVIYNERISDYGLGKLHFLMDNTGDVSAADLADAKMTILSSGSVGIGTTDPQMELQIHDAVNDNSWLHFTQASTGTTSSDGFIMGVNNSEQAVLLNKESTDMLFYTNNSQRMTIRNNGNVGIGAATPQDKLHVAGSIRMVDGNQAVGYIPVSDANGTMTWTNPASITTAADGDGDPSNEIQDLSLSGNTLSLSGDASTVDLSGYVNTDNQNLSSTNSGTNRTINISGGTGTTISVADNDNDATNEIQTLSLSGATLSLSNGGGSVVIPVSDELTDTDGDTKIQVEESADEDYIRFDAAGAERMVITSGGNVGVGTSTPNFELQIHDAANQNAWLQLTHSGTGSTNTDGFVIGSNGSEEAVIMNREATDMLFYTSNTQQMVLDNAGNLGVGTANPSAKLDVVGNMQLVDGTQGANKVLQSDASGNAAWGLEMFQSVGTNGYQVIGDLVIAWGSVASTTDGLQTVNFGALGFPILSAVYHVSVRVISNEDGDGSLVGYTTTNLTYNRDDDVSGTPQLEFMLIGKRN